MSLLTLAVSISPLKPPSCHDHASNCKHATPLQVGVFFLTLYIVAVGTGGTKPNISTMGADQFDDFEPRERKQKLSFFNWWMFTIFFGTLFANTFLIYIQDNVGWSLGYGLPTVGLALSILVFLIGTPFYRHKRPAGSPFAKMAMVLNGKFCRLRGGKIIVKSIPVTENSLHESSKKSRDQEVLVSNSSV
ncbi:hypothetical protein EJ110_NYTH46064 [Nymphaea thermarum]|nr:hypothetical protein EJ110_NYTH46064 [Nymphaea thermarum]